MNAFLEMCGKVLCVLLGLGAFGGTCVFVAAAVYMKRLEKKEIRP